MTKELSDVFRLKGSSILPPHLGACILLWMQLSIKDDMLAMQMHEPNLERAGIGQSMSLLREKPPRFSGKYPVLVNHLPRWRSGKYRVKSGQSGLALCGSNLPRLEYPRQLRPAGLKVAEWFDSANLPPSWVREQTSENLQGVYSVSGIRRYLVMLATSEY